MGQGYILWLYKNIIYFILLFKIIMIFYLFILLVIIIIIVIYLFIYLPAFANGGHRT